MREKKSMGDVYANYFSKTYIVCYRKNAKKITVSVPVKTPLKQVKTNAPPPPPPKKKKKTQTITIPHLLQAQPALALLILRFYSNVQTKRQLCRPYSDRFPRCRLISVCTVCPYDLSENVGSSRYIFLPG